MKYRQVLLLGNGLNLAYGGTSWGELISTISKRHDFNEKDLTLPMPLQAILMTNNNIKDAFTELKESGQLFRDGLKSEEQKLALRDLLKIGFDDILTTNYSYELEMAGCDACCISDYKLKKLAHSTTGRVEPRYMLHSYYEVQVENAVNRIWHIHGESKKPDSMILGHYWYGSMLAKMKLKLDEHKNHYCEKQNNDSPIEYNSWLDSFVMGDVHVLGFSFDPAEIDLWWLLNRKQREKADHGKVYFYEMRDEKSREKIELMRLMGVEHVHFDMEKPLKDDAKRNEKYRDFYEMAITDIKEKMER